MCVCVSVFSRISSFTLEQHNGERISRQAYYLNNNCTSSDDPALCNTATAGDDLADRPQESEIPENGCILPQHPIHGSWSVYGNDSSRLLPGMQAQTKTVLSIYCDTGYKLKGVSLLACLNDGKWSSDLGQCKRTCPPKFSTASTKVICVNNDIETENCTDPIDGTIAKHECAPFYENLNLQMKPLHICNDSAWSEPYIFECTPICGKKPVSVQMLIINGTTAKYGDYPWQVAIYYGEEKIFICGGTLISQRIILTAGHCLTNSAGNRRSKDNFIVAVGKHYSKYDDPRDQNTAQFSSLEDMYTPVTFHGSASNYNSNIGLLITTRTFTISQRVQPACVDWVSRSNSSSNVFGYVAGWGLTQETGNPSEELKEVQVPLINYPKCFANLPQGFVPYLTSDKICAGYLNKSTSICKGDSGSGLFVKKDDRYYIRGIATFGPSTSDGGCNSQTYALYTDVSKYTDTFILDKYQNDRNTSNCKIPQPPNNGKLSFLGTKLAPESGSAVSSGTTITVICADHHILQGSSTVNCSDGQWDFPIGICLVPCPPLTSTHSTEVSCNGQKNCINATRGTIATLKCAPFYENLDLNVNPFRICQNGKWTSNIPRCIPVCGVKPEFGTQQEGSYYPWNVAIYKQDGGKKMFTCAGTLVNERIILTSAQCISGKNGERISPALYEVAAGKSVEDYGDLEKEEAQFSELEEIFVPDEYKGNIRKYWADIAVLITKEKFTMTKRIQLLCLDWKNMFAKEFEYPKIQGHIAAPFNFTRRLFEIEVPFANDVQCYNQLSEDTEFDSSYYTFDKLCSGYINLTGFSSCKVNLGSGLVSKNRHDNRYYLTGIASVFPTKNCNNKKWVLFTQVSKYISNFVFEKNQLYTPPDTPYFQTACGVKSVQAQTLIINGNNVTKGDYPWQVAIYRRYGTDQELICGGSLINQRIILTAAHCVTSNEGKKVPLEVYTVAVGKYFRNFSHPDDKNAQFSTLIDVFVPDLYYGELQNYIGDIAMLITEKSFVMSREVQPVCVDWENKYETYLLRPNAKGYVTGWGFMKENDNPSQILKDLEIPFVEKSQCKNSIPQDYHVYLTFDKLCAGYLNTSKAVCRGDSGGGLVFRNGIDGRYYITGIVSISPQAKSGGCNSQQYAIYTKVSQYMKDFIVKKAQLYWR